MKGLEAAGFVHLYGLAPVLSALKADRRDFEPQQDRQAELDMVGFDDDDDDDDTSGLYEPKKPEAQFTPYLFLQDRSGGGSGRSGEKMATAAQVKELAEQLGIPIAYSDKGTLNALSGNRPHQVCINVL